MHKSVAQPDLVDARLPARPPATLSSGIGSQVRDRRRALGLKVTELAQGVGVSSSLISQIERGRTTPSVATLFMLAKVLQVPVDELVPADEAADGRFAADSVDRSATAERSGHVLGALTSNRQSQRSARRHNTRGYVVRRGQRATIDITGGVRWERLTPQALDSIEFLELVYEPHAESNPNLYRHPGTELVLVLSGRFDIHVGFERYELGPGDSIWFPSSLPHRYVNPTDDVARAVTAILRDAGSVF